jgi:hypothetical protein
LLHSFVNDVVVRDGAIDAVVVQTKQGPLAVRAKTVIDCTGDGDVAFAAGVPFSQGRDADGLCQPGTLNFRVAGVDAARLTSNGEDRLKEVGRRYREDYRAGRTGLSCKRQDLPFGRLTPGGQVSYLNYACAYGIDATSITDMSRAEAECRGYIDEMLGYVRSHLEGFENAELASIATEVCFRDSRRIHGRYRLTVGDMENDRHFDDVIAVYPRFYDMLAPDAYMDGDGGVEGAGYTGHIHVPVEGDRSFEIPFGCLVPEKIVNLLVAGRCISCDHVAQSGIRAISACMQTGEAAGVAAGVALRDGVLPGGADIRKVQALLQI